jgi:hypothetical protein
MNSPVPETERFPSRASGRKRRRAQLWLFSTAFPHALFAILPAVTLAAEGEPPGKLTGLSCLEAIPREAVAAYFHAGPDPELPPGSAGAALDLAAFLADRAYEMGLLSKLDSDTRVWVDALAALSVALRYPHAVVLLDVSARRRKDGGHQLAGLHAALIIDVRHDGSDMRPSAVIERHIQHLLNSYANDQDSVLTSQSRQGGRVAATERRFRIQDRRLPPWASLTFGPVGGLYVIAIGDGTFEQVAETIRGLTPGLAPAAWFREAFRAADGSRLAPGRGLGWYVDFDRLRPEDDPLLAAKIDQVLASLRLAGAQRGLWTVRYWGGPEGRGQAVEVGGFLRRNGKDELSAVADGRFLSRIPGAAIPDEADGYAIIDCNPRAVLRGLCDAYLAARSADARQSIRGFWRNHQEKAGVFIDRDVIPHLGRYVVIHDYPAHALGLPFMWTILFQVDQHSGGLQENLDQLLAYVSEALSTSGSWQLHRDTDGVWYLQFGIYGPALMVTEKWLIISFSPQAVRQNQRWLTGTRDIPTPGSD